MQPAEQSPATMTVLPTLAQAYFDELTVSVRGKVYRRGDDQYAIASVYSLFIMLISSAPTQVSRAYTPIQWKRSEHLQGRRTSP
jgi:hypothetical protein